LRRADLTRLGVAPLCCAVVTCCAITPSTNGSPGPLKYAALGDSVAAEPGVPDPAPPLGCQKSTNNYPAVLARRLKPVTVADVTCSGATSADVTSRAQLTPDGTFPPQIDAVTPDTTLITVTIGGNDVGLAADAAQCRAASIDSPPCTDKFVVNGVDSISVAIGAQMPVWAQMIDDLRSKAPHARIVLVGYPMFVRPGGCFAEQPILPKDADYFQSKVDEIDDHERQLATDKKVAFFDTRPLSAGHDMCAAPNERYVEGFVVVNPGEPLHPNGMGAAAIGNSLAEYINAQR
jgi:lysophospholipase L1-like esterase